MLEKNAIKPSTSPWSSPIVLLKSENGSLIVCVDYRKFNAIARRDSFQLPRIDTTLDTSKGLLSFQLLIEPPGIGRLNSKILTRLTLSLPSRLG